MRVVLEVIEQPVGSGLACEDDEIGGLLQSSPTVPQESIAEACVHESLRIAQSRGQRAAPGFAKMM